MDTFELSKAKDQLEDLVRLAASGEDVLITDARYGTMRLIPVHTKNQPVRYVDTLPPFVPLEKDRVFGRLEGILKVPEGLLDSMTEEELREWYGEPNETLG
jgi:antitoxin (DNA-binding transcriptional repressor) of toxin-antitoxin stability system